MQNNKMIIEIDDPNDIPPQQPGLGWHSCPRCDGAHRPGTPCRAKQTTIQPAHEVDAENKAKLEQVAELATERRELRLTVEKAESLAQVMTHAQTANKEERHTASVRGGELRLTIDRCFEFAHVTFVDAKQLRIERAQAAIDEAASRMARRPVANTDREQAAAVGELEYVPLPHVA